MLDWLKTILGDSYTEEIDNAVSKEIGKGFVARADFNAVNDEKKNLLADVPKNKAAGVAEFLKKYDFDNEDSFSAYVVNAKQGETELSQKATRLENEKRTLEAKIAQLEGNVGSLSKEKSQLARLNQTVTSGTVRPEFAEFVVEKVSKDMEDGDDFTEKLAAFIEAHPQFGVDGGRPNIGHQTGGKNDGDFNPFAKETRDIAAQTRLFRENPAKARQLAKEAGVKI
jgi:hypothetical protein